MKNVLQLAKKSIALTLALSLLYSQLLWAADVRQMLLDAKAAFDLEDTRRGDSLSAEELEAAQSAQESEIDQQEALQDLQGMNFSLTTQNGDILSYVGNVLKEVKRPDGTVLKNLVTDAQGLIQSADLKLSDGSIQVLRNGEVVAYELPDGTEVFYESGRIQKTVTPLGLETRYSYTYDADQNLEGIILENIHTRTLASPDGKIKEVLKKSDGSVTTFSSNGLIDKITYSDGSVLQFQLVSYGNDQKILFHTYTDPQGAVSYEAPEGLLAFEYLLYRADGSIKEALLSDGQKLKFSEEGTLTEAEDSYGHSVSISFQESALSNILGTQIVQGGLATTYNAKGDLESIRYGELTLYYKDSVLDYAKLDDGTILRSLQFDEAGNLSSANVTTPDGEERIYANGKLTSLTKPDETKLFYFDDKITQLLTPQGLSYDFNYEPETIHATLNTLEVPDALTPVRMEYDGAFNLKKIILQNEEILNYLDDRLISSVSKEGSQTFYDDAGNILKTVIASGPDNPHTLEVIYKYGKIRQILKGGVLTFKYSYSFENGEEITTIEDLEEKSLKTYKDSLLLTSLSTETSVLSTYEYDSVILSPAQTDEGSPSVSKVTVTRFGRVLHTYTYAYEETHTIVTDEEGIKRTYSDNQKLLFLEKEGKKFSYEYWEGADGQEIVEEKLIQRKLIDGSIVYYANGLLDRIELSDGSYLTDVISDSAGNFLEAAYHKANDPKTYIFSDLGVIGQILQDGTHLYYRDGKLSGLQSDSLGEFSYAYQYNGALLDRVFLINDDLKLQYNAQGALLGVQLLDLDTPEITKTKTTHAYQGGLGGPLAYDGDFNTRHYESLRHASGGYGNVSSTHNFGSLQGIDSITFRMMAYGRAGGNYIKDYEAEYYVSVLRNNAWERVQGSYGGHTKRTGSGSTNIDSGKVTLSGLNLKGVTAIQAFAHGFGNSSDNANADGAAGIYEIQWSLMDQSYYKAVTSSNNLSFSGYEGIVTFDSADRMIGLGKSVVDVPLSTLESKTSLVKTLPYMNSLQAPALSNLNTLLVPAKDSILSPETVMIQEYSSSGILEAQTKADQTTTLFRNNRPFKVLDSFGAVLTEYVYDGDGHLAKVTLTSARETLPKSILKATEAIETQKAQTLLVLAKEKKLAYQSIEAQARQQREYLQSNLNFLKGEESRIGGMEVHGSQARSMKADAIGQIGQGIGDVYGALTGVGREEAKSYAALNTQVKTLADQIEADSQKALKELAVQEGNLKKEILKQEISPVVYDHYRRILGRDPSTDEYNLWLSKIDYDSNLMVVGERAGEAMGPVSSLYFDGDDDRQQYAAVPDHAGLDLSTGNWTIDTWFNIQSTSSYTEGDLFFQGLSWNHSIKASISSGQIRFTIYKNGTSVVSTSTPTSREIKGNTWYHLAITQESGYYSIYLNGVLKKRILDPDRPANYAGDFRLGMGNSANNRMKGFISEFRVTKGIARWTGPSFAVPQGPAVPDSNTSLLLRVSGGALKDLSASNQVVKMVGSPLITSSTYILTEMVITQIPILKSVAVALVDYLTTSTEVSERTSYVNSIKAKVTQKIQSYLLMSDLEKNSFAAALGLTGSDLIPLSSADVQKILVWLESRSLHFGQSAFLSLESLLDQKGISYAREDIAERSIIIDILSGIISPLDDGDLVISVFALNKVASLYGIALSGANLSWEDLLAIYQTNPTARVIAHINGNHFVIITGIANDRITYIDPGIGKDKQNESLVVAKRGFLKAWKGYVTGDSVILNAAKQREGSKIQLLSAEQTKAIRGAFWGSLLSIFSWVVLFTPLAFLSPFLRMASIAVSIIEGDWITAITSTLGLQLPGGGTVGSVLQATFTNVFNGVTQALGGLKTVIDAVGGFASNVYGSVTGFLDSALNFLPGIGPALQGAAIAQGTTIGAQIVNSAISTGLSFGVSLGLESLGVSPSLSGFLGDLAAGAIIGGLSPISKAQAARGVTQATMIQSSLQQTITLNQVGRLGLELGIDPSFTNIIGLSIGAMQGTIIQNPATSLEMAFNGIKPQLFSSLAQWGADKLSSSIGLPSIVGQTLTNAVLNVFNVSYQGGADVGRNILQSVQEGLLRGAISYGVDFASRNITNNAILQALSSRVISGALEGSLLQRDLFKGVYDALKQSVLGVFSANQADLLANAVSLSSIIAQQGAGNALEIYLASIFNRQSVESIERSGGITSALLSPKSEFMLPDGSLVYKANVSSGEGILFDGLNKIVGFERNGLYQTGEFGTTPGGFFGLISGKSFGALTNGSYYEAVIQNGRVVQITTISNQIHLEIRPETEGSGIRLDIDGTLADGQMSLNNKINLRVANGTLDGIWLVESNPFLDPVFMASGLASRILQALQNDTSNSGSGSSLATVIRNQVATKYIFGNGFENERRREDTPDRLMTSYITDLEKIQPSIFGGFGKLLLNLYEETRILGNAIDWITDFGLQSTQLSLGAKAIILAAKTSEEVRDLLFEWALSASDHMSDTMKTWINNWRAYYTDTLGFGNNLVDEVVRGINASDPLDKAIAFVHSGATAPLLAALEQEQYDIETVLIYEGPHPNYGQVFTNPHLKRIIHVQGSGNGLLDSFLEGDSPVPFLGEAHFNNTTNTLENINIEIKGAFHSDFSYDGEEWNKKIEKASTAAYGGSTAEASAALRLQAIQDLEDAKERNRRVNIFMRDLYQATLSEQTRRGDLGLFLKSAPQAITYDESTKIWHVDPKKLAL